MNFLAREMIAEGERLPFFRCRPRGPQVLQVGPDNLYEVVWLGRSPSRQQRGFTKVDSFLGG